VGGIAFGYSDGYWDREHRWHGWRDAQEAAAWRAEHTASITTNGGMTGTPARAGVKSGGGKPTDPAGTARPARKIRTGRVR
jgi:hypothetical protein